MKTLRDAKMGETVKVVKLTRRGRCQAPHYGHGHYQGCWRSMSARSPRWGILMEITVRGYELSLRKADAEMIVTEL